MAKLDYRTPDSEKKADDQYDPYSGAARDLYRQEKDADAFNGIAANYGKTADDSQENDNIAKAQQAESSWKTNVQSPKDTPKKGSSKRQGTLSFLKKRGPIIGIGGGLTGIIIALLGFLGPASLPISLMENFTLKNDSSSTTMQRRFMKVFGNMTENQSNPACTKKSIKCKMGKISNSGLRTLARKGVVPVIDGEEYKPKRTGYPEKNPTAYRVTADDGKVTTIPANEMRSFLADKNNRKIAAKVLGTGGAFNFRLKAWAGKHIATKFYSKFGIKRDGGIADGNDKETKTVAQKISEALAKLLPKPEGVEGAADRATASATRGVKKAKKGGAGYTVAVASCVGIKAPGIIAGAAAAVQLAQIMPIVMNLVLSPASKAKASGVEIADSITSKDAEAVGNILTEQTKNTDGKMTSALDSQQLLAAIGVNKGKPKVSKKFAPGYGLLTNPVVVAANKADQKLEPACNAIMSPAAMYTAMAVDAAVTVAASATIIGGIIKIAASWAISELAMKAAEAVVSSQAKNLLLALAENDSIPKARGEELGDIIGVSAAAFFSAGGMSRHLPTLTESQLVGYDKIKEENETFNKEMEVASHSPFDASSQYTFLGNIVHNVGTAMIANGDYSSNLASNFMSLLKLPAIAFSTPIAGASDFTDAYCKYAKDFKLDTEDKADTPAVNMSGLPCTGITEGQDKLSTANAIDLLEGEGWICNSETEDCPDIADDATIEDLMPNTGGECDPDLPETCHQGNGYIKKDTLLYDYIESCSDAASGDYLFNSASCTVPSSIENAAQAIYNCNSATFDSRQQGGQPVSGSSCDQANKADFDENLPDLKDPRSIQAMAIFLVDYQVLQSVNGEDKGEEVINDTDNLTAATPDDVKELGRGWTLEEGKDYTSTPCASGTTLTEAYTHPVIKSKYNLCKIDGTDIIANSLLSANVRKMIDDAKKDGIKLNGGSFRDVEAQIETRKKNCTGDPYTTENCNPPTAKPGTSQHERGLAIDFTNCDNHGTACYKWLNGHAKKYGFYNFEVEPWHWSTSGN